MPICENVLGYVLIVIPLYGWEIPGVYAWLLEAVRKGGAQHSVLEHETKAMGVFDFRGVARSPVSCRRSNNCQGERAGRGCRITLSVDIGANYKFKITINYR